MPVPTIQKKHRNKLLGAEAHVSVHPYPPNAPMHGPSYHPAFVLSNRSGDFGSGCFTQSPAHELS